MNERIEKLVEQAGPLQEVLSEIYGTPGRYIKNKALLDFQLEKFAEKIINECCVWIDGSPTTESGQLLLTKSFIIVNIKAHFGVKQ